MRAFSYAWSLPVTLQSWYSLIWRSRKAHATRRLHGSMFIEWQLWPVEVFCIAEIGIFDLSCSCDLDLDPITFI